MITRYQRQLREGYYVPDSKYERWFLVYILIYTKVAYCLDVYDKANSNNEGKV